MENFEKAYENIMHERVIGEAFEKIEIARAKVAEKYKGYQECLDFLDFIKTIEKIFVEAGVEKKSAEEIKDSLIRAKISLMAQDTPLDENVLNSIYDDFKKAGNDISQIMAISQALMEKYKDNSECQELITYIQYVFVNFEGSQISNLSEMKDRLIKARMQVISSDGKPELIVLENIYHEFIDILEKAGK